jgi:hypothetical protein
MRKMMLAATMMFAACGTSDPGDNNGSNDDGSGSNGSGMDAGVPMTCTSAEECGGGAACDIATHECVMGALTIEPTAEIVQDGSQWWTVVADPTVRGTFEGPTSAVIEVMAGSGQPVIATMEGNTWSAKLAAGSIAGGGTAVKVTMTDPSGGMIELQQQFRLDDVAPQITLGPSKLRDERGDTIDFSTGEPIHTHAGAEIDLGSGACASVYKYAYLMGAQDPTFGSQASQNPLAWNFDVADAKIVTASYRVRNANNQVLLDWTPVMPAPSGAYRVGVNRDMLPELGSYAGQLSIDLRARDWAGLETTYSRCVDYHPIAAPLAIEALAPGNASYAGMPGLFSMSLVADSPVSMLSGIALGAIVADQRITQYTAEPTRIALDATTGTINFARTYVDDFVVESTTPISNPTTCGEVGSCDMTTPADPADSVQTGAVSSYSLVVALVDETTNTIPFDQTTIPARAANAAPHTYRVVVYVGQIPELRAPSGFMPSENSLLGLTYTGLPPAGGTTRCGSAITRCHFGTCVDYCSSTVTYKRIVALDHASLALSGVTLGLRTSPAPSIAAARPPHVPASMFQLGAMTWDAGNDDLPGPK